MLFIHTVNNVAAVGVVYHIQKIRIVNNRINRKILNSTTVLALGTRTGLYNIYPRTSCIKNETDSNGGKSYFRKTGMNNEINFPEVK